jgi:hypothetical protein
LNLGHSDLSFFYNHLRFTQQPTNTTHENSFFSLFVQKAVTHILIPTLSISSSANTKPFELTIKAIKMDAIITNLEKSFKSLATKVRHSVQNEEILKETAEVEKIIRSASVKKTQPKLRKVAVTQLPTIRIPEIFHLKKVLALPFKLAPPPNTRISVPQHLSKFGDDSKLKYMLIRYRSHPFRLQSGHRRLASK